MVLLTTVFPSMPGVAKIINDNHCTNPRNQIIPKLVGQNISSQNISKTVYSRTAVIPVPIVVGPGQPQKKGLSPDLCQTEIKHVKSASFVSPCRSVPHVPNVHSVAENPPVGCRLHRFWETWLSLGSNPWVVSILKDGYNLPFKMRPPLTRCPLIISGYANPRRNKFLKVALQSLITKQAVEKVVVRASLAFYNRLFIVPKPNNKWRPILDLSKLYLFLHSETFKMETPETIRLSLQKGEWVTSLDFSDAYFHIPINPRSRKYLRFHLHGQTFQFRALPFGLATAPLEFTKVVKEVKLMAQSRGIRIHQYLDDWLLRAPCREACVNQTRTLMALCQQLGWLVNLQKSELVPQQEFNFVGYHFDLSKGLVKPTQERWQTLTQKIKMLMNRPLFGPRVHVSHRFVDSHRETGGFGAPSHETDSVVLEESLARARGTREGDSSSQISIPSSAVVAGRKQCAQRPTSSSSATCSAVVYRRLKRRLGRALRRPHGKRSLVGLRKPVAHKLSRAKGGPSGPQEVRATVLGPDHFDSHGQHNGCLIHQQGGGYEIRLTLCPPLETAFLVQSQTDSSKGQAHSGKAECDSRQIVQEHSGYSDRMVPPAGSLRPLMCQVAHSSSGSLCNKVQSQTTQVCVPSIRSTGMESRCSQPELGEYGCLRVPSCVSFGQGGVQDPRSGSSQVGSDCSRVAQHALVLGSSQHVCSDSSLPSKRGELADPTVQSVSPQRSPWAQPPRLAPRASSIQAQGFSDEVATRIEAPQRQSTRAIYESKWSIFVKWCESHKVDFGSPSLNQVAEFLLFLFKEKNLQPSTIDGYRTAIADKIGCDKVNFGKDENLTRLLDSFHRDKPKGLRGVPSWNLSLVLHQLTQSPFEPLRKVSLKHLTFKTVFLLALGSGKRRSEIHAWVHRNIRHQEDWANVSLFPSPCFLSKNQLAKEGPSSVAPVIIPALAPTLDKSLKEDRTLCPVRALRYYLDKTKDLRSGKQLVFVSFKKNFNKDIAPATISSWIKQTILLCYQLSNEDAQQLHQVRAHDVRAFAASKAFQGGVSLDQILSACHWKSHNTFTQFYLKDVAWADADLYHLGPVVAAQHIRE